MILLNQANVQQSKLNYSTLVPKLVQSTGQPLQRVHRIATICRREILDTPMPLARMIDVRRRAPLVSINGITIAEDTKKGV
jgi:predicted membrane chloride channel (bestrophin family)